jgi:hypothetical protein
MIPGLRTYRCGGDVVIPLKWLFAIALIYRTTMLGLTAYAIYNY